MPTIEDASFAVTNFPNRFVSPYGNDGIVPLYSSVPLKSPVEGCLECIVCGNSNVRHQVIINEKGGAGGGGAGGGGGGGGGGGVIITPVTVRLFGGPEGAYSKIPQNPTGYFKYLIQTDWDDCLMSTNAALAESIIADGITYTSYNWPYIQNAEGSNLVDGHTVWERNSDGLTATCIEATGNYVLAENNYAGINFVGAIYNLTDLGFTAACPSNGCCPDPAPNEPYTYLNQPGSILCNSFS